MSALWMEKPNSKVAHALGRIEIKPLSSRANSRDLVSPFALKLEKAAGLHGKARLTAVPRVRPRRSWLKSLVFGQNKSRRIRRLLDTFETRNQKPATSINPLAPAPRPRP